jgi:hypothetical protein
MVRTQISLMPDGTQYFCVACTVRRSSSGFHSRHALLAMGLGCRLEDAHRLVYADGLNLDTPQGAVPIGVTCRLCERMDCTERAFPAAQTPLSVDENVRGLSFYRPGARTRPRGG